MYFCSGPPRTYALLNADASSSAATHVDERIEDVAVAVDPLQRVVARVTSSSVSLYAVTARSRPFHSQRLLATAPRAGKFVANAVRVRETLVVLEGVADGGCTDVQRLSAVWITGDRLAVAERGSQFVEFYAFDGLPSVGSVVDPLAPVVDGDASTGQSQLHSPVAIDPITIRFVDEYPLNQGESIRDRDDVAWAMSGINGGKHLFLGMESGIIGVVDIQQVTKDKTYCALWKIDVLVHLQPAEATAAPPVAPSCYALTAASWDPPASVNMLALIACFEGGKCFIMLVSPTIKSIDQLLSLVNTEKNASSSCYGRCTTVALDGFGARLALGWSDGGVSLFRLALKRPQTSEKASVDTSKQQPKAQLQLEPQQELSMSPGGYTSKDIGGVIALAWTHDARALAVGYEERGFAVFSTDGCRLMSSLPQHNHERPADASGNELSKEVCPFGTVRMAWTAESTSLLVVPRGQPFDVVVPNVSPSTDEAREEPPATAESTPVVKPLEIDDVCQRVDVVLLKEQDGLCLSLSGAPGRCGAWVRSDNSFTWRKDGGVGPAEASNLIRGGDLLVAINGDENVVNLPFEQIIQLMKALPNGAEVQLAFLRLQWEVVYPLAVRALSTRRFLEHHQIRALLDDEEEELCVREYALRMQEQFGDCDELARPPLIEFEKRAKFEGWEAIQGTSKVAARHKYIKLMLALFPVWSPMHILHILVDFSSQPEDPASCRDDDDDYVQLKQLRRLSSPRSRTSSQDQAAVAKLEEDAEPTEKRRRRSRLAFAEYDFARSVPLADRHSKLVLIEDAAVRNLSSPTLDDPCALVSTQSWHVPAEYDAKCCPLRLVALSKSGQQVAIAGQRGFCLLNVVTGKWRLFGNVHEEQDLFVHSLLWIHENVVLVSFSRFREQHKTLHVVAYPRNHLDQDSVLAALQFPRDSLASSASDRASSSSDELPSLPIITAMETDEDQSNVFCLLRREMWCLGVSCTGSLPGKQENELQVSLAVKRQVRLPSTVLEASPSPLRGGTTGLLDFTLIPRVLHVGKPKIESHQDDDGEVGGWFSSMLHLLAGGEVPDQYKPEEVLPRVAFLTAAGDVIVWDPENRSQRLVCSNITTVSRLFVTDEACSSWPTSCRLLYGLYGPEGMRLWLPLLDGVYLSHTKAFEQDETRLQTFLGCHDPLRAKTYEIEFGTAPATAELYEHVVREYDIALEDFVVASITRPRQHLADGVTNLRGCITTVDDPASKDLMLRFDADVTLLGLQHAFGLLVGVSQDVYMPPGATTRTLPCYDVFSRVQPFFHSVLCLLVRNHQLQWAGQVLSALRKNHIALSSPTQELFLHAMLEACFSGQIPKATLQQAITLLRDGSGDDDADLDEYCEIVAHVARKSEPSRLSLLFPAAGDPLALVGVCRQRGELHTAANFLLVLDECSACVHENLVARNACAAALVGQCMEHDEWALAKHVVRVAREWVDDEYDGAPEEVGKEENPADVMVVDTTAIDEQLASLCWQELVSGRLDRVVQAVTELQATLPRLHGVESGIVEAEKDALAARVRATFVETGRLGDLEVLLGAVKQAQYEQWTLLLQRVLAEAGHEPAEMG